MVESFAKSEDPDQMPYSTGSDLGLHYLPVTCLGVSSLQWINYTYYTPPHNSGGVLWFHVGRPCVCPSVVRPSIRPFFISG